MQSSPVEIVHNCASPPYPRIASNGNRRSVRARLGGSADDGAAGGDGATGGSPADGCADRSRWGELGCPKEIGLYRAGGGQVRVKRIHIIVAENDPAALFTVVAFRPPLGPAEFVLGHRVA